jgi:tryptophanyl-tRNA synthetase
VVKLGPVGNEMKRLSKETDYLDAVLRDGGERASAIARPVLDNVKDIVGLLR